MPLFSSSCLLSPFTPTPPLNHQSKAIQSDVAQVDEGWMWLPAEPAVVAPELARNSPFRSEECPSLLHSKSKGQGFWAVKFLLAPETWGRNVSLTLNCPVKALPTSADISANPHVDIVCQRNALWKYVSQILAGNKISNTWPLVFLEHRKTLGKTVHVLKKLIWSSDAGQ